MGHSRVGIVGGSLTGLTAALLLRDAGWDVDVFERAPHGMQGTGAGLTVQEPTVRYLLDCGIALDDITFEVSHVRYIDHEGKISHDVERAARFTTWGTIHRGLLQHFGTARFNAATPVLDIVLRDDDRPFIVTSEGEHGPFDLVVGADGVSSVVRAAVAPGVRLEPAGYLSWRCVADASRLSKSTMETLHDALTYCIGDRTHGVMYPVPPRERGAGERVNLAWYRNYDSLEHLAELLTDRHGTARSLSVPPGYLQEQFVHEMRRAVTTLAPQAAEIVAATDDPFVQLIGDVRTPRMVYGRVVLIGDAACVARPHVAAGAAKGAENAWTLAAALADWDDDPARLALWERDQLRESEVLVHSGKLQGYRGQVEGTWDPEDATFDLRQFGERVK